MIYPLQARFIQFALAIVMVLGMCFTALASQQSVHVPSHGDGVNNAQVQSVNSTNQTAVVEELVAVDEGFLTANATNTNGTNKVTNQTAGNVTVPLFLSPNASDTSLDETIDLPSMKPADIRELVGPPAPARKVVRNSTRFILSSRNATGIYAPYAPNATSNSSNSSDRQPPVSVEFGFKDYTDERFGLDKEDNNKSGDIQETLKDSGANIELKMRLLEF